MEISALLTSLPAELLPIAIFAILGLQIFKAVMPYFRKPVETEEDDYTDAVG